MALYAAPEIMRLKLKAMGMNLEIQPLSSYTRKMETRLTGHAQRLYDLNKR